MDLPSRQSLVTVARRFIRTAAESGQLRINPAMVDVPGSDVNLIVGAASLMGEAIVAAWAKCIRGLFVDTAQGDQLDRIAYDRFGITRNPANAATTDISLIRPTDGAGGGTVAAGTRIQTSSGSVFAIETDVTFGATDLIQFGTAVAQVVGSSQNVSPNTLTSFVDQPFDQTIMVSNGQAAGGTDAELDADFRGRIRRFWLTVRRGTLAAIQYGATTGNPPISPVDGVKVATAYEIINPGSGLPAGAVDLIIADAAGNASGDMVQQVINAELTYRAAGIPVFATGGTIVYETVNYMLDYATGIDVAAANSQVANVAVAISQSLAAGQPLLRDDLARAARAVPGVIVMAGSVAEPTGDIIPPNNQTLIRLRLQDISFG